MTLMNLPKMVMSDTEGWSDVMRVPPSVGKMFFAFVVPMSLIPPVMYAYAQLVQPGMVFAAVHPPLTAGEAMLIGALFFLVELATVSLMAAYIRELGGIADIHPDFAAAYTLAAIAPAPLWLSALALFVPGMWFSIMVGGFAWFCSVGLIRHGVRAIFHPADEIKARRLANLITAIGVALWMGMLLLLMMLLGMMLGWR
jgi:hypothetical protein